MTRSDIRLPLLGLAALVALVIVGPWLASAPADYIDFEGRWAAPPSLAHPFGTDDLGRDVFARVCVGGRLSLAIGVVAALLATTIGVVWGAAAGWFGGVVDAALMRGVDVLYALPFSFLVILLMARFGTHPALIFVAIGMTGWLDMARLVRARTRMLKTRPFIEAARIAGLSDIAIIGRHLLPNLGDGVAAGALLAIPQAILVESLLSFLGLGIREPATSWGMLIDDGVRTLEFAPWMLLAPAVCLVLTLLALNALGEALRARGEQRP